MAGHSAWKNIKHRKAAVDAKRGRIWSKLSRAIIVAARNGGSDTKFNATLRLAVLDAKAGNMPRDTIEKAIKKGAGESGGERFDAVRYEGYGPGGVAVVVEALTSNVNRTAPEVRAILDKNGGKMGVPGSVVHSFSHKGVLLVPGDAVSEDRIMELALEAGAESVQAPVQKGDDRARAVRRGARSAGIRRRARGKRRAVLHPHERRGAGRGHARQTGQTCGLARRAR